MTGLDITKLAAKKSALGRRDVAAMAGAGSQVQVALYSASSFFLLYGTPTVNYKGYRDGKGSWENWTLMLGKGGFHIWPLSEGPALETAEETDEKLEPAVQTNYR